VDDEANVYVTGRVKLLQQGQEYMGTIKYDSSGREVWMRWEAGPLIHKLEEVWERERQSTAKAGRPEPERWTWSSAYGTATAVDNAGSVYVAGGYWGHFGGSERGWVLVKYDAEGRRLWTAKGPDIPEPPMAMAVDQEGSVYIIGNVISDETNLSLGNNFLTVKYSPEGEVLWSRRGWNHAHAKTVTVDTQGNVYVGGSFYKPGPDFAWFVGTVSYDANGSVRWEATEEISGGNSFDVMASRASNNGMLNLLAGSCRGLQWLTYSLEGERLSAYPVTKGPTAAELRRGAIDVERLQFTDRFCEDDIYSIALGSDGSAYLGGLTRALDPGSRQPIGPAHLVAMKVDLQGRLAWRFQYESDFTPPHLELVKLISAIAVDHVQNVYVAGSSAYGWLPSTQSNLTSYMTFKFDSDGKERWVASYEGQPTSQDVASDIALDDQGHLYAGVYSSGWEECQLFLYDADGRGRLLSKRVAYNEEVVVAANREGGAYLLCTVQPQIVRDTPQDYTAHRRYILARHDQNGTVVWSVELRLSGEHEWKGHSNIVDMLADEEGNLYLVAFDEVNSSRNIPGSGSGFRLFKYNPQGHLLWTVRRSTEGQVLSPRFLNMNTMGRLLVIGEVLTKPGDENSRDVSVIQYDTEGKELWEAGADFGGRDFANAATTDPEGNIYVTGLVGLGIPDIGTVKYDSHGNRLWTARYDGGKGDGGSAITVDPDGNIYVSGNSYPTEITIMYTPDGRQAWVQRHQVRPRQMLVTPGGTPVLVGITLPGSGVGTASIAIVAFDQMGGAKWVALYDGGLVLREWNVTTGEGYIKGYGRAEHGGVTYQGSLSIYRMIADHDGNLFVAGSICKQLIEGTKLCHDDALLLKFATE
jgi:hypothetical protein